MFTKIFFNKCYKFECLLHKHFCTISWPSSTVVIRVLIFLTIVFIFRTINESLVEVNLLENLFLNLHPKISKD